MFRSLLQVTSGTGVVAVRSVIDRETDASFSFTLIATDGGTPSQTSSANVTVTVIDVNDNAPTFTQAYYNTEVGKCLLLVRMYVWASIERAIPWPSRPVDWAEVTLCGWQDIKRRAEIACW